MDNNEKDSSSTMSTVLQFATITVLFAVCGYLLNHIKVMSQEIQERQARNSEEMRIRVGDFVPSIEVVDLDSNNVMIDCRAEKKFRLLQIVSSGCTVSDSQVRSWWPAIAQDDRLEQVNPALISIDTPESIMMHFGADSLVGGVYTTLDHAFRRDYRMNMVPMLLLIDPNGRVVWTHVGALDDNSFGQMIDEVTFISSEDNLLTSES